MLVATKFYNDIYYSNSDIATISGVPPPELNAIERYFCEQIGYKLYISSEELAHYEAGLENLFQQSERPQNGLQSGNGQISVLPGEPDMNHQYQSSNLIMIEDPNLC